VWQPRLVPRTRYRIGDRAFSACYCTASIEQDTDGAGTAAINWLVLSWSENICFVLSMGTKIRIDSVMRPRSSGRGRNTSASVTVTWFSVIRSNCCHWQVSEVLCTGKTRLSVHGWLHSAPVQQPLRHVEPLSPPLAYVDIEVCQTLWFWSVVAIKDYWGSEVQLPCLSFFPLAGSLTQLWINFHETFWRCKPLWIRNSHWGYVRDPDLYPVFIEIMLELNMVIESVRKSLWMCPSDIVCFISRRDRDLRFSVRDKTETLLDFLETETFQNGT